MRISAYTTLKAPVDFLPWRMSIEHFASFCDEVVVLDSTPEEIRKNNNYLDKLNDILKRRKNIKVISYKVPWDAPNFGIYDGITKTLAKLNCTNENLIQFDLDEVFNEKDPFVLRKKIEEQFKKMHEVNCQLMSLPLIEFWGKKKIRIDVNPWKPRLMFKNDEIIHGIPVNKRKWENGLLYAQHGTDGCDLINKKTGLHVACYHYDQSLIEIEVVRQRAIHDENMVKIYESWLREISKKYPTILHFSWWNIEKKIKAYKEFWAKFWATLYNENIFNPFIPERKLEEMTDEEIKNIAKELEIKCGGVIFHKPWQGERTNWIRNFINYEPEEN